MPLRYPPNKRLLIPTLFCVLLFFICGIVFGQPADTLSWQTIETKHTVIRYQSSRDLKKINSKIKYRVKPSLSKGLFSSTGPEHIEEAVKKKVDALFERAQQILDMRKKMKKVTINVYHDKNQLREAFQGIYLKPCHVRAWYEYRFNTVYICIEDMHEGMLAHEMAHGIIDHYLLVRPPPATAEILARYVDSHLKK